MVKETDIVTPQQKLIAFCKSKARLLNHPSMFILKDLRELKFWDKTTAKKVINKVSINTDIGINPWCLYNGQQVTASIDEAKCLKCGYGLRHGVCGAPKSTHRKIIKTLPRGPVIVENINFEDLFRIVQRLKGKAKIKKVKTLPK